MFPFLSDYSGDYDTVYRNSETGHEAIYNFDHEDEVDSPSLLHRDKLDFVKAHIELFARGIYFLGDHGRLETDYEAEQSLMANMNP